MRSLMILFLASTMLMATCQETKFFGQSFDTTDPISVDKLIGQLDESGEAADVMVTGTVEDVCQVKGCWMTMTTEDGTSMRVTFKDYGFFVPMDIHGKNVVIRGNGEITVTSVDDLKHYAEDEGKSEEEIAAITEDQEEYVFIADGVYIGE